MLLVVDVGNTNTVFGLFELDAPDIVATARMSTRRDRMPDEWYAILAPVLESAGVQPGQVARGVPALDRDTLGRKPEAFTASRFRCLPGRAEQRQIGKALRYAHPATTFVPSAARTRRRNCTTS